MEMLSLFDNVTTETAATHERTKRYFYRCTDCLSVAATKTKIPEKYDQRRGMVPHAVCDACDGRIEFMGETSPIPDHIRRISHFAAACDARCTNARGPDCDCACGGENHGSGRLVPIYMEAPTPRIRNPRSALAKATIYRQLCEEFRERWNARYKALFERRARREWLQGEDYQRFTRGQRQYAGFDLARAMRSHHNRNKAIQALIDELNA